MKKTMMQKCLKISLMIILTGCLLFQFTSYAYGQSESVAKILFLYTPDCQDCMQLLAQDIPMVLSPYGNQVELTAIDASLATNNILLNRLQETLNLPMSQVPMLIIGKTALIGKGQITSKLDVAIKEALVDGGVDYPMVMLKETNWLLLIAGGCVGLLVLLILLLLLLNAGVSIRQLTKKSKELQTANDQLGLQVKKLGENNKLLEEAAKRASLGERLDVTLEMLIGLTGSSVDLLSEAQRILYFRDKRSAEDTAKDANGYLITLLRSIAASTGIKPLAAYQDIIPYDERYHTCFKQVAIGEKVKVVETGWAKGNVVIKKAVVEKI